MELAHKILHDLINYDPKTGVVEWRERNRKYFSRNQDWRRWNNRFSRQSVNSINGTGYYRIGIFGKRYLLHRIIWFYITGYWPDNLIDHDDQNKLNNKWRNLKASTKILNAQNIKLRERNTSGFNGVSWCKSRQNWETYITVNKKRINLGRYNELEVAIEVRKKANIKYNFNKNHGKPEVTHRYL
jgi:hypothetical protein